MLCGLGIVHFRSDVIEQGVFIETEDNLFMAPGEYVVRHSVTVVEFECRTIDVVGVLVACSVESRPSHIEISEFELVAFQKGHVVAIEKVDEIVLRNGIVSGIHIVSGVADRIYIPSAEDRILKGVVVSVARGEEGASQ